MVAVSKHILLAEDDSGTRLALSSALRSAGYKVTAAENGREVSLQIHSLRSCAENIDLLILDIFMPGMNGVQVIDLLAQIKVALPIIVITGYATTDLVDRLKRKGCLQVLRKPFKSSDLLAVIEKHFDKMSDAA